ncbi:putative transposase, partial [Escherichia coli P0302308.13]
MHQGKDVIGEAGRVGVVLLDPQVGLVVQQAVEHI